MAMSGQGMRWQDMAEDGFEMDMDTMAQMIDISSLGGMAGMGENLMERLVDHDFFNDFDDDFDDEDLA